MKKEKKSVGHTRDGVKKKIKKENKENHTNDGVEKKEKQTQWINRNPPGYYEDPYKTAPVCKVNLLELSRYARKLDKKLVDLTKDEVERFVEDEHTSV